MLSVKLIFRIQIEFKFTIENVFLLYIRFQECVIVIKLNSI